MTTTSALENPPLLSEEEYLAGEELSETKHEYLNGVVHAMAGARVRHNRIAGNIFGALYARLRGKKCQPFNSDMLVRVRCGNDLRFYYPDVMVVCDSNAAEERFQDEPVVIFEVRSESTARIDQGEKREAYCGGIPSLGAYVLVEDEKMAVTVWRRDGAGWKGEYYTRPEQVIRFESAGCELPLAEIYERVEW